MAQRETGAAITIHPGRDAGAPHEILEVIDGAGGDVRRTVMGHLDRTLHSYAALKEFAAAGSYLEFDIVTLLLDPGPGGKLNTDLEGRDDKAAEAAIFAGIQGTLGCPAVGAGCDA